MNLIYSLVLLVILIEFLISITYVFIDMKIVLILNTINTVVLYLFYRYFTPSILTQKGRYTFLWLVLGIFAFIQVIFISKKIK